jgi:hypothetical protein
VKGKRSGKKGRLKKQEKSEQDRMPGDAVPACRKYLSVYDVVKIEVQQDFKLVVLREIRERRSFGRTLAQSVH